MYHNIGIIHHSCPCPYCGQCCLKTFGFRQYFINNIYILSKEKSMNFKHKVYNHKRKVGIDFWGYGPDSLGIEGQKGAQRSILYPVYGTYYCIPLSVRRRQHVAQNIVH